MNKEKILKTNYNNLFKINKNNYKKYKILVSQFIKYINLIFKNKNNKIN
jgi:hypothetical protein